MPFCARAWTAASLDAAVFIFVQWLDIHIYFFGLQAGIDCGVAWFVIVRTARFQRSWK